MRRDMGSPDDQFVKAAEQGKRLHFADKPPPGATMENAEGKLYAQAPRHLQNMRKIEGFNPQGEAQTLYGKHVENKIDFPIGPYSARELLSTPEEGAIPASMKRAALENPEMRFYLLDPWISQELKLEEMHDFMHNMRRSSNTLTRYGQTVTIPEQYRFTDETLKGLTPAQASERVALAKKWVEDNTQRMASQAVAKAPGLISHEYSNGSKWASFPDLAEDSNLLKMVQDVGCDAGWCTKAESTALTYGSEENKRLHILFDSKSRPKAQVTLQEQLVTPNDFFSVLEGNEYNSFMKNHPNIADAINGDTRMQDWEFENLMNEVMNTPEYKNWASQQGARITEIKGVENKGYLANEPYVKEIQDFVRRMDKQYKLQSVANLDGIGMSDLATAGSSQSVVGSAINEQVGSYSSYLNKRIAQRMQELNGGSSYVVTDDIPKLVQRAIDDVMGPMKHSTGGMIERRTDDLRRYL